jgi:hypothetical protein
MLLIQEAEIFHCTISSDCRVIISKKKENCEIRGTRRKDVTVQQTENTNFSDVGTYNKRENMVCRYDCYTGQQVEVEIKVMVPATVRNELKRDTIRVSSCQVRSGTHANGKPIKQTKDKI